MQVEKLVGSINGGDILLIETEEGWSKDISYRLVDVKDLRQPEAAKE